MATDVEELLTKALTKIGMGEVAGSKAAIAALTALDRAKSMARAPIIPPKGNNLLVVTHWVLDDALGLVRDLQPGAKEFGFHITLGGGVLNRGWSKKDLDLFFLPYEGRKQEGAKLVDWLGELWGKGVVMGEGKKKSRVGEPFTRQVRVRPDGQYEYVGDTPPPFAIIEESFSYPASTTFAKKMKFKYGDLPIDVFIAGEKWEGVQPAADTVPTDQIQQEAGTPTPNRNLQAAGSPVGIGTNFNIDYEMINWARNLVPAQSARIDGIAEDAPFRTTVHDTWGEMTDPSGTQPGTVIQPVRDEG